MSYVFTNDMLPYLTLFMFYDPKININTEQKDWNDGYNTLM